MRLFVLATVALTGLPAFALTPQQQTTTPQPTTPPTTAPPTTAPPTTVPAPVPVPPPPVVVAPRVVYPPPPVARPAPPPPPPRKTSGIYASVGLGGLRIDEDPFNFNPGWGSFTGRLGYAFNESIAVEGETSLAFNPYTFDDDGTNYDDPDAADLSSAFGVYAVPSFPISPGMKLYGRAGYLWSEYDYSSGPLSGLSTTSEGPGFGIGLELGFGPRDSWSMYMDWTWYGLANVDTLGGVTNEYDASGSLLSIGATWRPQ